MLVIMQKKTRRERLREGARERDRQREEGEQESARERGRKRERAKGERVRGWREDERRRETIGGK